MEFNATFIFSLISFLVFMWIMNIILYKPIADIVAKRQKYLEDNMRLTIESFDYVKSADVMFTIPKDTLSVLEDDEETYVSVKLQLKNSMPNGAASSMAQFIATAVGNPTTNNVTIIDSTGNTLFQGSSNYTDGSPYGVCTQRSERPRSWQPDRRQTSPWSESRCSRGSYFYRRQLHRGSECPREAGAEVLGIVSIFTYGMKKGLERLAAAEVKNVSLCDLDTLVEVAADKAYIAPEDKERLIKFRNNPSDESWMK